MKEQTPGEQTLEQQLAEKLRDGWSLKAIGAGVSIVHPAGWPVVFVEVDPLGDVLTQDAADALAKQIAKDLRHRVKNFGGGANAR